MVQAITFCHNSLRNVICEYIPLRSGPSPCISHGRQDGSERANSEDSVFAFTTDRPLIISIPHVSACLQT